MDPATNQTVLTNEIRASSEVFLGRCRTVEDTLAPEAAEKLAVILGLEVPEVHLPPTFHWAYFNKGVVLEDYGADLHERTGIFLPPAPFSRRMWAASEVTVLQPLRFGIPAARRSTVAKIAFKHGSSGDMCFVSVDHEIEQEGIACISEVQTIVYRDPGAPDVAPEVPDELGEEYYTHPDSQLFFYSAVTHNGHRIHWDRHFCREVEGYPDLVVHGPMMATELCEAMRDDIIPCLFAFRATAPVFTTTPVRILPGVPGNPRKGSFQRADGVTSMVASYTAR